MRFHHKFLLELIAHHLNHYLHQQLCSASTYALRVCSNSANLRVSFKRTHKMNKRAMPDQMMNYKHALCLHKIRNNTTWSDDWINLNFQQLFNNRNKFINPVDTLLIRVGKNLLVNRLTVINNTICQSWLNLSLESYQMQGNIYQVTKQMMI